MSGFGKAQSVASKAKCYGIAARGEVGPLDPCLGFGAVFVPEGNSDDMGTFLMFTEEFKQ